MATKTFEELKQLAIQIRDEKTNKQNTATRVGTEMLEHLNKLEQDYYDKTKTDEELKKRDNKLTELDNQQYKAIGKIVRFLITQKDKFLYYNYAIGVKDGMSLGVINVEGVQSLFLSNVIDGSNISNYKYINFLFYTSDTPNNENVIKSQGEHIYNAGESSKTYLALKVPQDAKILAISSDFSGDIGDIITKENVYAICVNKDTSSLTELQEEVSENQKNIDLIQKDIKVNNWDWENNIDDNVAQGAGNCIFGNAVEKEGYLSIKFYQKLQDEIKLLICNWDKSDGEINIEEQIPISVNAGINEILTDKKISAGKYIGLSMYYYNKSQKELGESYIVSNKYAFKGEMLSYTVLSETSFQLLSIDKELKENIEKTDENEKGINENKNKIALLENKIAGITGNEFWVKAYGNTFNKSDYVLSNSEVNESSIILNQAEGYAALNKRYWSDRRIHRFIVTPTSLGELKVNMAQNTSNLLFSDMTAEGNWTSEFRIDMNNNKIYIGKQEFDSNISFVQGRKYIVELKYIRRIFYVTVTDFLTGEETECTLDTSASNQNGAFKCYLTFENISGSYTIEQVETYLVSGVLLILFGNSVTESCGRVGKGENYSEIIAEKYGSVTIVAQGGAGQSSWSEIFENEIKYIKPKYCSWHMGLNGGFNKEQIEQVITDCEGADIIPIINHVISFIVTGREETILSPALNTIVDEIWAEKGYRGYYGDIATAKNNNINDKTNYSASNSKNVPGGFDIIKTSASYDAFYTYTIPVGKTVIENGEQRVLDTPLEVIMNIHPKAEGHRMMAERYFLDVKLM